MDKTKQLEERLVDFAVGVTNLAESLPKSRTANHLAGQIIRSATAPALIYGEARGAESKKDFAHKLGLILKELRETHICLRIIEKKDYSIPQVDLGTMLDEANELISIFVVSFRTAKLSLQGKSNKTDS